MISTKTINNQNAITNAVLGTDDNSNTTINGNLLIQDTNNNSTFITPLSITKPLLSYHSYIHDCNTITNNNDIDFLFLKIQKLDDTNMGLSKSRKILNTLSRG